MIEADEVLGYVRTSASLLGLAIDPARQERVAQHLRRTAELAALLEAAPLAVDDEPPDLYCPAPFTAKSPHA